MLDFVMRNREGICRNLTYDPVRHLLHEGEQRLEMPGKAGALGMLQGLKVRIALGKACNFSCAYCCQHMGGKGQEPSHNDLEWLVEHILRVAGDAGIAQVQCWGGEPLLYFDTLKKLHTLFAARVPNLPVFFISTNGSLLHGERLRWILDNKIMVAVSWDGPGQSLRGEDVLREGKVLDAVRRIYAEQPEKLVFAPVMTRQSATHRDVIGMLAEKLGSENFRLSESRTITVVDAQSMAAAIPMEELAAFSRRFHADLVTGKIPQVDMAYERAWMLATTMSRDVRDSTVCKCFVGDRDTLVVDMAGNLLTCHTFGCDDVDASGEPHCLGHITNLQEGERKPLPTLHRLQQRQLARCTNCAVFIACRGGCPYEPDAYSEYNCAANYHLYLPIMGLALHMLTGDILEEVRTIQDAF